MSTVIAAKESLSRPVLIIGSGLGGLTLAHGLRKRNIPCLVFERDAAVNQRAQGYRISIDEGGSSALHNALPPDLYAAYEASCGESHPPGGRLDGPSGKVIFSGVPGLLSAGGLGMLGALGRRYLAKRDWAGLMRRISPFSKSANAAPPALPPGPGKDHQVDRSVLRSLLLSRLDCVTFGREFASFKVDGEGVTAIFADGTKATGSLLVGADGIRSKVAHQLIGSTAAPRDLGLSIIYGKTPLKAVSGKLHSVLERGTNFVTDTTPAGHRLLLVQEAMRFSHAAAPEHYVFWALSARREVFEAEGIGRHKVSGSDAAGVSLRLTSAWDERIRILFERQSKSDTAFLRMVSSDPDGVPAWTSNNRVTVLGDAVHCMPPTGGQGANSAIYDAALLASILGDTTTEQDGSWSTATIRAYEDGMRYNIGDIVGLACIAADRLIGRWAAKRTTLPPISD